MHTRALGHAFLFPSVSTPVLQTMGRERENRKQEVQTARPRTPEAASAFDALKDAKRLYMAARARHDDLVSFVGRLKADEAVGQAASNVENAKVAYQDALAKGA